MQKIVTRILSLRTMIAGSLLVIFGWYYANIALFSHYHIIDGVTIVHSHIHNSEHSSFPGNSAAHTKSELTLLSVISNYTVESPTAPFELNVAYLLLEHIYTINNEHTTLVVNILNPSLRGPPAQLLIG